MKILTELEIKCMKDQIQLMRMHIEPKGELRKCLSAMTNLIEMFINYIEANMDQKMHQVTKRMKTAEKEIREHKEKKAMKTLHKAEKKNEKLVKIDKNVRDPLIKKAKKIMRKGCK